MNITDNTFSRQFELRLDDKLITLEYSFQEKKIFLTRLNLPESLDNDEIVDSFLKEIMQIAIDRKLKVVPILPRIAKFFKKNQMYKELLPPGIKI